MKNLLSNWSGRLLTLLFPAALAASIFSPAQAAVVVSMSSGGENSNGMDGDPLDTNDYGGGGGGGSDIHDSSAVSNPLPPVLELGNVQLFLVTDFVGGKITFKIIAVEKTDSRQAKGTLEGTHAP